MADWEEMLKNPQMMAMLQLLAKKKNQVGMDRMKGPSNALSNLADAYPQLKDQSEKMKIQEAEQRVKKMKFDMLLKQAEQQYKLKEQQMAARQQEAQIEAARRSV